MVPTLKRPDGEKEDRLRSAQESGEFIADNLEDLQEEHGGEFIVVHDGAVVTHAETAAQAIETTEEQGIEPEACVIKYIPEPGQSCFF